MNCFYCDLEVKDDERKFYYGVERPYINLKFHLECAKKITNIAQYIQENSEKVYNIIAEQNNNSRSEYAVRKTRDSKQKEI